MLMPGLLQYDDIPSERQTTWQHDWEINYMYEAPERLDAIGAQTSSAGEG